MDRTLMLQALRRTPLCERVITAFDVPDTKAAVSLSEQLGSEATWVKIGMELFTAEGPSIVDQIGKTGKRVFLDLKYKDIPNTVAGAVRSAAKLGVGMLTLHADGGRRMLEAAVEAAHHHSQEAGERPALLAVTVLTSLTDQEIQEVAPGGGSLSERIVRLASVAFESGCDGIVCAPTDLGAVRAALGSQILVVTPGVRPKSAAADDQRRVATPASAMSDGADFLVVGRPITKATNPATAYATIVKELSEA